MRFSLPISMMLHAAVLAWALFSVSARVELKPAEVVPIAVELVTISEKTDLRAGDTRSKSLTATEKKEQKKVEPKDDAAKQKRVAALPPKAEEPKKVEPKKEEPKKPEPKTVEEKDPIADILKKKAEEKKAEEPKEAPPKKEVKKPKPEPPKKSEKPKKKEQTLEEMVAALQNKLPDAPTAQGTGEAAEAGQKTQKAVGGKNTKGTQLSVTEVGMIEAIIQGKIEGDGCWSPPVGAIGADKVVVRLKFRLGRDGSVDGTPDVLNNSGAPQFIVAAEAAIRAVMDCSPYERLANELGHLYDGDGWNSVVINFDPKNMFGG